MQDLARPWRVGDDGIEAAILVERLVERVLPGLDVALIGAAQPLALQVADQAGAEGRAASLPGCVSGATKS